MNAAQAAGAGAKAALPAVVFPACQICKKSMTTAADFNDGDRVRIELDHEAVCV